MTVNRFVARIDIMLKKALPAGFVSFGLLQVSFPLVAAPFDEVVDPGHLPLHNVKPHTV